MKAFYKDENFEKVYIQVKDILFLMNHNRTPKDVKDILKTSEINLYDVDEYATFTEENVIRFLKYAYFILDTNLLENRSIDYINMEFKLNELNIKRLKLQKKLMSHRERKKSTGIDDALKSLNYYRKSLKDYIKNREKEMKKGLKK